MKADMNTDEALFLSLLQEGVSAPKLMLKSLPESQRGLVAVKPIKAGETVLRIPFRHLINLKTIAATTGGDWQHPQCPAHAAIAVHLLYYKYLSQEASKPLQAYLASLPGEADFAGIPVTWTQQERTYLPPSMQSTVNTQHALLDRHYALAQTLMSQTAVYTSLQLSYELFRWAWLVVNSRSIYQQLSPTSSIDDNYTCAALVDMLNHAPSNMKHAKLLYDVAGLTVEAQSAYEADEEVCISYGAHGNDFLVIEYGFRISDNQDNSLVLDDLILPLLSKAHQSQLSEMGYLDDYTLDHSGRPSFRIEVALRLSLLADGELHGESGAFRRVVQFSQGLNSGRDTQAAVKSALRRLLNVVISRAKQVIETLPVAITGQVRKTIVAIHQDHIDMAQNGLVQL